MSTRTSSNHDLELEETLGRAGGQRSEPGGRAELRVRAQRLGEPTQRREVLGDRGRRATGALELVAAGAYRRAGQVLEAAARPEKAAKLRYTAAYVRRVSGERWRAATSARRAARAAGGIRPPRPGG